MVFYRSTTTGKMAAKAKAMAEAESSQHHDEDINMIDPEYRREDSDYEDDDHGEPMEDVEEEGVAVGRLSMRRTG